ncbi:kinetochore-associated Ndc80 complex subunit nuf2 [Exophiala xenobiotica]|uniref:Probable kinetochore protein NUF2 n=1 Tax=Lithohypha guttulata TaxID=1690604 RepID=A0ABR0JTZ1_9EURO|nr:kinetochore-associated Ndc80 complex subunit nuf2 [Lithohypha guttulata]KAK5314473.1 kinetochore-associated Ndc80 complex subunit nuf2 [Exophiala xenobiotica]
MNSQYRSSHQAGTKKRKEEDPDAFMRLSDQEIAGCISDIGVPFSEADLRNPKPQQIQMVFEHLGDILMNATRDSIDPAMRAACEDICNEYPDLVPVDTRLMMGFFVSLRKMLIECGVHDFSMNDLVRPTYERLGKIFSYVINFIRFREGQTDAIDENFNKAEETKNRIEQLYTENDDMQQRLEDMKRNRKAMEAAVKEKVKRNDELKARLLELRKGQERIAEQLERSKAEKNRAQQLLEDKTERLVRSRQESEKLRPYVLQSPAALQGALTELQENLMREKSQIDMLERRTRALQTSSDSFGVVHNDVQACVRVLEEIAVELQKEEEEDARAAKNKEALNERGASVREVEQNEKLLQRQLSKWEERIEELRRKHKEREDANKAKMEELWEMQRQLREERASKSRDMDRRKGRIDQTEKKMAELKEAIEKEVKDAQEEYLKLESHIKLYITEMEQSIS